MLDAPDGYTEDRWWRGLTEPEPESAGWPIPNHPRETVSWHEAMAFCAWLSHRLGLSVRLPTEAEWERAVRGTDGREFPWDDGYQVGYASADETWEDDEVGPNYLKQTSAVGIYPQGASPAGVLDLAGNVWEWCRNEARDPERVAPDGTGSRALRGGSWSHGRHYARAPYRFVYLLLPVYRDGFFVVWRRSWLVSLAPVSVRCPSAAPLRRAIP